MSFNTYIKKFPNNISIRMKFIILLIALLFRDIKSQNKELFFFFLLLGINHYTLKINLQFFYSLILTSLKFLLNILKVHFWLRLYFYLFPYVSL